MKRFVFIIFAALVMPVLSAQENTNGINNNENNTDDAKELSGMSILGNDEAPKSLFIVPWRSSEIGFESGLMGKSLLDSLRPLDKEVFTRELDYFDIRSGDK